MDPYAILDGISSMGPSEKVGTDFILKCRTGRIGPFPYSIGIFDDIGGGVDEMAPQDRISRPVLSIGFGSMIPVDDGNGAIGDPTLGDQGGACRPFADGASILRMECFIGDVRMQGSLGAQEHTAIGTSDNTRVQ